MSCERNTQSRQQRPAAGPVEFQVAQHSQIGRTDLGEHRGDQARFAAFVAGLTEALAEPDQRALVTESLSPLQQRALRLAAEDHG